eukprot:TRINITY_DN14288_c2_g1_i1.p1 TRINITY_DN14288_c2_g1~~TRINITY_DN14288_c2_g1_i1.p1  ORF type:complete len:387 (+),score=71.05 TRINITY_DN14288_c2_g1_i1:48-1163(+)
MSGKASGKPKPGKNAIKDPNILSSPPDREIPRYRAKYEQICAKYKVSPIDKFVKKLNKEAVAWKPETNDRRFEYRMGDKGGDFPPNIPLIFNESMSFAATKAVIDSFAFWPSNWKHMNILSIWRCWGSANTEDDQCSGDDGAMLVHEFLKADSSDSCNLQNLEIIMAQITAKGCSYLGRALTQNESLKYLNLSHNREIGDAGATALGEGLKWNSTLEILKLEYCGIGWKGGEEIGRNIVRASSLKELHLKGNNLGSKGIQGIAQALAKNMTLVHLDLADNCFGIHLEAVEALRDGIETNDSLTSIDLNLNSLVPAGATMLLEVLKTKPKIEVFHIYERVEDDLFEQIIAETKAHVDRKKKGAKKGGKKRKD